jgi:hypothetical protein
VQSQKDARTTREAGRQGSQGQGSQGQRSQGQGSQGQGS